MEKSPEGGRSRFMTGSRDYLAPARCPWRADAACKRRSCKDASLAHHRRAATSPSASRSRAVVRNATFSCRAFRFFTLASNSKKYWIKTRIAASAGQALVDELDDVLRRSAWQEDLGDARLFHGGNVC